MVDNKAPQSLFGAISIDTFLETYWRKKPLLVRNAWPGFVSPLDQSSTFMLACREDADSQLILEKGGDYPWEAVFGPFEPGDFEGLPESHWTLLVHETERLVPEINQLLEAVPFLPNWRFDDVMVSYAADQGGVGAHIDQYDVFLLQGAGERVWQIDETPVTEEVLLPDLDVRILADFTPTQEWTLTTGDMLYLPPLIAHSGVAVGMSITYSIGCRAPSTADLVDAYVTDYLASGLSTDPFSDDDVVLRAREQGRVQGSIREFAFRALREALDDPSSVQKWLGRYLSSPARGHYPTSRESVLEMTELLDALKAGARLRSATPSQLLYDVLENGQPVLYAGGEAHIASDASELALAALTSRSGLTTADCPPLSGESELAGLLLALVNEGFVRLETTPGN